MRTRYQVHDSLHSHFVTSTIVQWLPVFTTATTCNLLVEALAWYQANKGLIIYGGVILDNHFHAILQHEDLPRIMADLKKFTARKLLVHLQETGKDWLLNQFLKATETRDKAFKNLKAWTGEFRRIAKRVLRERPDLLGKLEL